MVFTWAEKQGDSGSSLSLIGTACCRPRQGIDRTVLAIACGRCAHEAEGMSDPLVRKNMFYSGRDISAQALLEATRPPASDRGKHFEPVTMKGALPEGFDLLSFGGDCPYHQGYPGERKGSARRERVDVEIILRPFRKPPKSIRIELKSCRRPGRAHAARRSGRRQPLLLCPGDPSGQPGIR